MSPMPSDARTTTAIGVAEVMITGRSVSIRLSTTFGSVRLAIDDVANSSTSMSLVLSATARIARTPFAPVRYSPITGRARSRDISGASTFATRSTAPPAGKPCTSRSGCAMPANVVACAVARPATRPSAAAASALSSVLRVACMRLSPFLSVAGRDERRELAPRHLALRVAGQRVDDDDSPRRAHAEPLACPLRDRVRVGGVRHRDLDGGDRNVAVKLRAKREARGMAHAGHRLEHALDFRRERC